MRRIVALIIIVSICAGSAICAANSQNVQQSSYWSDMALQENSLAASVLYVPYMVIQFPVRIIDGIINPVPTSRSDTPPPAHRGN